MIFKSRSQRLCQACRADLQFLFEYGTSGSSFRRGTFASRSSWTTYSISTRRNLSSTSRLRSVTTGQSDVEQTERPRSDVALEEEMLALQNAAVAELEAKLGKSLEQAIAENTLGILPIGDESPPHRDNGFEVSIEDAQNPLEELRLSGVSEEGIAREARQIFGDFLPNGTLNEDEFKIYRRLYGDPAPEDPDERAEISIEDEEDVDISDAPTNALFDIQGERIQYQLENQGDILKAIENQGDPLPTIDYEEHPSQANRSAGHISAGVLASSTDIVEDIAHHLGAEVVEQDEMEPAEEAEEDEEDEERYERTHPLTRLGKFSTRPRTTFLPQTEFVRPVTKIMSNYSNKQLREMCERIFGGPGLPDSPLTPRSARTRKQIPIPLDASQHIMGQMEANAFITSVMPPTYASILSTLVETRKRLGSSWLDRLLARPNGLRILDAGSGGIGILAWREVIKAHWDSLDSNNENLPQLPASKAVVLTGSDVLRHRAAEMLENTTFIPRLPDYAHIRDTPTLDDDRPAQQRKQFDVIIASHSLLPLKEEWERKQHVHNLWSLLSDDGGVLILIEKGIPRGFETLAGAREFLLERFIALPEGYSNDQDFNENEAGDFNVKSPGMIVAPCTNHEKCPLYRTSGTSHGRKDICSFQQRYIRPPFLQRILGAKDRNHDDVNFSYLSVMKGDDLRNRHISTWEQVDDPISAPVHPNPSSLAEPKVEWLQNVQEGFEHFRPESISQTSPSTAVNPLDQSEMIEGYPEGVPRPNLPASHTLPRVIYPPLKRRGHVTFDVCTPAGQIERWTIPKSFSKQAYRDARKARWGDLWALGAKTCISRNIKTGTPEKEMAEKMKGAAGKAQSKKERRRMLADSLSDAEELEAERDLDEIEELRDLIEEDGLMDEDDEDGTLIDMDTLLPVKKSKSLVKSRSKAGSEERALQNAPSSPGNVFGSSRNANRYGEEDSLKSWASDFAGSDADTGRSKRAGSGKHGGAFAGRGSASSKAAKREQKRHARSLR